MGGGALCSGRLLILNDPGMKERVFFFNPFQSNPFQSIQMFTNNYQHVSTYFIVGHFACAPDSFEASLMSGETLLQEKNSTGCRWDSNPGPLQVAWPLQQDH